MQAVAAQPKKFEVYITGPVIQTLDETTAVVNAQSALAAMLDAEVSLSPHYTKILRPEDAAELAADKIMSMDPRHSCVLVMPDNGNPTNHAMRECEIARLGDIPVCFDDTQVRQCFADAESRA